MLRGKQFSRVWSIVLLVTMVFSFLPTAGVEAAAAPKYVFMFIGDGLGAAQRQAAEYYLAEQKKDPKVKLLMNTFPVAGINTTYAADTLVTDSAAAGTALATGHKTNNDIIAKLPNGQNLKTLVECAEEKGIATGLVTTTRITHATPAVFASHNMFRDNENEIAVDYLDSGVDFLAGGGYRHFAPKSWTWGKSSRTDERNLLDEFAGKGYRIFATPNDTKAFRSYQPKTAEKVVALFSSSHEPYEIDRRNNDKTPSLPEMTDKAIQVLSKYPKGFFLMVEGGRIDHACHANDAPGSIVDTLAFDQALAKAYEFYQKHPNETMILVVGDHETGGMGLGFASNYFLKMNELLDVKISVEDALQNKYKTGERNSFFQYAAQNFSLDKLTAGEKAEIEKAMDIKDKGVKDTAYGPYDPVAIACTHVLSERANLFWTTYAHSGTAIPLSAIGIGAASFGGYKDNTEIGQAMAQLLNFQLSK